MHRFAFILWAFATFTSSVSAAEWVALPPLPDRNGFAGSFAGVSGESLIVAGGANFPDKKPWEGGKKVWSDQVFLLDGPGGEWKAAGHLPRPLGYGISVTHGNEIVCVGGSNAEGHYGDAFSLEWKNGALLIKPLPPLPKPLALCSGSLVGSLLYVAGGQETPDAKDASRSVFVIDLAATKPRWHELPALPGSGRILSIAAACDDAFWIAGGAELFSGPDGQVHRRYLNDAFRYEPGQGWKRLADLPFPVAASPSPAPCLANGFCILGGDDGTQINIAPDQHRGFGRTILQFDSKANQWREAGQMPAGPVTAPVVRWGAAWVICSGELYPGIRSPQVWSWTPAQQE